MAISNRCSRCQPLRPPSTLIHLVRRQLQLRPFRDGQPVVAAAVVDHFSDRFKISMLNELLFYVANMFVTKRCGWAGGRRGCEGGAACAV